MGLFKDLTGQRFGRLIVVSRAPKKEGYRQMRYNCRCDCGKNVIMFGYQMTTGATISCGCYSMELRTKHGHSRQKYYGAWEGMKQRCLNPNAISYHNYGGRGITICEKWLDFQGFWEDMGPTYFEGGSLERNDVNGNYCFENCKWIPLPEQALNKRKTLTVEYQGKTVLLKTLCEELGINFLRTYTRVFRKGWSIEEAVATPADQRQLKNYRILEYKGQQYHLNALAAMMGIKRATLAWRIDKAGMSVEEAVSTPVSKHGKTGKSFNLQN